MRATGRKIDVRQVICPQACQFRSLVELECPHVAGDLFEPRGDGVLRLRLRDRGGDCVPTEHQDHERDGCQQNHIEG